MDERTLQEAKEGERDLRSGQPSLRTAAQSGHSRVGTMPVRSVPTRPGASPSVVDGLIS
jgi:hypothetical protein